MSLRLNFDYKLLAIVFALLIIGLPMVFSASHLLAFKDYHDTLYFLQRQTIWMGLGIVVMLVFSQIPYTLWRRISIPLMGVTILGLIAVFFFGALTNGAKRWFSDGSFQPSELAKLVTVIYVGHWLATRKDKLQYVSYGLIPFYVIVGGVAGLIVIQPDLSTGVVIVFTALAMFYAAGAPVAQLVLSTLALSAVVGGMFIVLVPWRLTRLLILLDPLKDKTGDGFQIYQMLLAMASGGWKGNGFASLTGMIGYLPASHTDAIFAVIGNDFGIVGCSAVIVLFALLTRRGLRIAERAADSFGYLLATGITVWLACQALLNVSSTTATIPFTGIPLPFISFGGSALMSCMAAIGILLNIAQSKRVTRTSNSRMATVSSSQPAVGATGRRSTARERR